jgi:hypothetical protein
MFRNLGAWMAIPLVLATLPASRADEPAAVSPAALQSAVARGLPLLVKGAKGHIAQRTCFACHNQAPAMLAFSTARARGFAVDPADLQEQLKFIGRFLSGNRDNYRQGRGQGGQLDTAGYALFTLELGGWQADETTEAVAEYVLLFNKDLDHWRTNTNRPPSEASSFTVNYLAIRGLQKWGTAGQKERIDRRIASSRAWLLRSATRDTEDRVFRLLALHAAGVDGQDLQPAIDELLRAQRPDGGWAQLDTLESDSYATGSVLTALHLAAGLDTSEPAYQRGLAFLLRTQQEDGSWMVKSRSKPFQLYYESGFPHGKDQFISMSASGWAVTALALACPPVVKTGTGE